MRTAYLAALLPFLFAATAEAKPLCREYTSVVKVGNRNQESYGTACLQADGSWQVQRPYDEAYTNYVEPEVIYIDRRPIHVHERRRVYREPRTVFRIDYSDRHRHYHHRHRDRYDRWDRRWR